MRQRVLPCGNYFRTARLMSSMRVIQDLDRVRKMGAFESPDDGVRHHRGRPDFIIFPANQQYRATYLFDLYRRAQCLEASVKRPDFHKVERRERYFVFFSISSWSIFSTSDFNPSFESRFRSCGSSRSSTLWATASTVLESITGGAGGIRNGISARASRFGGGAVGIRSLNTVEADSDSNDEISACVIASSAAESENCSAVAGRKRRWRFRRFLAAAKTARPPRTADSLRIVSQTPKARLDPAALRAKVPHRRVQQEFRDRNQVRAWMRNLIPKMTRILETPRRRLAVPLFESRPQQAAEVRSEIHSAQGHRRRKNRRPGLLRHCSTKPRRIRGAFQGLVQKQLLPRAKLPKLRRSGSANRMSEHPTQSRRSTIRPSGFQRERATSFPSIRWRVTPEQLPSKRRNEFRKGLRNLPPEPFQFFRRALQTLARRLARKRQA